MPTDIMLHDRLLTLKDMERLAQRSRASLYRDMKSGDLEKRIGRKGTKARWTWAQWLAYRENIKNRGV